LLAVGAVVVEAPVAAVRVGIDLQLLEKVLVVAQAQNQELP